jgi:hypothetical protein
VPPHHRVRRRRRVDADLARRDGAIVGARSAQQVDGWIQAGVIQLTAQDVEEIGRAIRETRAGAGPVMPPASSVRTVPTSWEGLRLPAS